MDIDKEIADLSAGKKAPRKPRPSEIAAKVAKGKKKSKAKAKKKAAKKARKVTKHKALKKGQARKLMIAAGKRKPKASAGGVVRYERLDFRLSKAEKARVKAKAKKLRRTVTSIVLEAIEKIK